MKSKKITVKGQVFSHEWNEVRSNKRTPIPPMQRQRITLWFKLLLDGWLQVEKESCSSEFHHRSSLCCDQRYVRKELKTGIICKQEEGEERHAKIIRNYNYNNNPGTKTTPRTPFRINTKYILISWSQRAAINLLLSSAKTKRIKTKALQTSS